MGNYLNRSMSQAFYLSLSSFHSVCISASVFLSLFLLLALYTGPSLHLFDVHLINTLTHTHTDTHCVSNMLTHTLYCFFLSPSFVSFSKRLWLSTSRAINCTSLNRHYHVLETIIPAGKTQPLIQHLRGVLLSLFNAFQNF